MLPTAGRPTVARPERTNKILADCLYSPERGMRSHRTAHPVAYRCHRFEIPDPYRSILDHEHSMTQMLDHYSGRPLSLGRMWSVLNGVRYLCRLETVIGGAVCAGASGRLSSVTSDRFSCPRGGTVLMHCDIHVADMVEVLSPRIVDGRC
jgi:hypothetical protein